MANYIKQNNLPAEKLIVLDEDQIAGSVILEEVIDEVKPEEANAEILKGKLIFTTEKGLEKLRELKIHYEPVKVFDEFHVTMLTGKFINKKTREESLQKRYLVQAD